MNNNKNIKFVFFRHGQTIWNDENRAQGSSNDPILNGLTEEGKLTVRKNAETLREHFSNSSLDSENVYIYTAPMYRTYDTSRIINEVLNLPAGHLIIHPDLNGRAYGEIEGQKDIKNPKTMIKNPQLLLSYILSQMGIENNGKGIEPKQNFQSRVFDVINDVMTEHKRGDTIILACNSDIWDTIRKSPECENCFNFSCKESVGPGEFSLFELKEEVLDNIEIMKKQETNECEMS